jgi:hypothetical protein
MNARAPLLSFAGMALLALAGACIPTGPHEEWIVAGDVRQDLVQEVGVGQDLLVTVEANAEAFPPRGDWSSYVSVHFHAYDEAPLVHLEVEPEGEGTSERDLTTYQDFHLMDFLAGCDGESACRRTIRVRFAAIDAPLTVGLSVYGLIEADFERRAPSTAAIDISVEP